MAKTKKTAVKTTATIDTKNIQKACALSSQLLNRINEYADIYVTAEGKSVTSEYSLQSLQDIIEEGLSLYNFIISKKLNINNPEITISLINLSKFIDRIKITKENAERLHLADALQLWQQTKIAIALLANSVLNKYEGVEDK